MCVVVLAFAAYLNPLLISRSVKTGAYIQFDVSTRNSWIARLQNQVFSPLCTENLSNEIKDHCHKNLDFPCQQVFFELFKA